MKRVAYRAIKDQVIAKTADDHREAIHTLQDYTPVWKEIDVEFTGSGIDTPVRHGLSGATRYLVVRKSAACDVYDGVDASGLYDPAILYLRGTAAAIVTLRVWSS